MHVESSEVRQFLRDVPPGFREVVLALRDVVKASAPGVAESILWGGLSYHRPSVGGRVKGAVCQIGVKRGAVRLEFIHGVHLTDRSHLLRGTGVSKRYVPVPTVTDARDPRIATLIREAAAFHPRTPSSMPLQLPGASRSGREARDVTQRSRPPAGHRRDR
ncbi:MAG: DUF1801 domain-containing protein [Gemmatimonadaceae bacterium]|nr:DUF1801 domain-containing protein [Gemmatimonadaceae bacterium]